MKHELKTWPEFFEQVISRKKKFEIRRNDRNFQTGDVLILKEYIPGSVINGFEINGSYSGRQAIFVIDYILYGYQWGIRHGFLIMSISPIDNECNHDFDNPTNGRCKLCGEHFRAKP